MGDETDQDAGGSSLRFVLSILWSLFSIAAPLFLWSQGIYPVIMLGAAIGSFVRFGTDIALFGLIQDISADGLEQFLSKHIPIVIAMMVIQFGTFIAGLWLWLFNGDLIGAGIVLGMLLSWIVGVLLTGGIGSARTTATHQSLFPTMKTVSGSST
jgi:hypothetical protein